MDTQIITSESDREIYSDGDGVNVVKIYVGKHDMEPYYTWQPYHYALVSMDISGIDEREGHGETLYLGGNLWSTDVEHDPDCVPFYAYVTRYNDEVYVYGIDNTQTQPARCYTYNIATGLVRLHTSSTARIYQGTWSDCDIVYHNFQFIPTSTKNPSGMGELKRVNYGDASIPVQWRSTRYEKTYQDSFNIHVYQFKEEEEGE